MAAREPSATVQLKLRLKEDLRAQLERHAKRREVSLNAEINHRLRESCRWENVAEFQFTITDLNHLWRYVTTIRAAIAAAGGNDELWFGFTHLVPFNALLEDELTREIVMEDVKNAVRVDLETQTGQRTKLSKFPKSAVRKQRSRG